MQHRAILLLFAAFLALFVAVERVVADPAANGANPSADDGAADPAGSLNPRELVGSGGVIGWIILVLSVAMLALIVEHLLSIRRATLLPDGLAKEVNEQIAAGRVTEARKAARESRSFLGDVLDAGLAEADLGYDAVEKAMEDTAVARTSRLYRKIEYLSIIGTIAPMLGLLGTVWGMILAFLAFETKANPQVSELAPGITRALVTTFLGLGVAVPALAGYGVFRNRIEGLTDEGTQLADHVFTEFKRADKRRKPTKRTATRPDAPRRTPEPEARS